MDADCEASVAQLRLAQYDSNHDSASDMERQAHLAQALESSQSALKLYEQFGFVQVAECTSEEILFRHSQALAANDHAAEAAEFLGRAHAEMMRKHDLIPADSPFRTTYLDNIQLHQEIQTAYAVQNTRVTPPLASPYSNQERSE
jgi:hypothetical protein